MSFNERLAFLIQQLGGDKVIKTLDDISKAADKAGKQVGTANDGIEKKATLAERAIAKLGLTGKVTGDELKAGVAVGATTAAAAVAALLEQAANDASALNEQVSAANVTFGDGADTIEHWAESADRSIGLSERAALQAANAFGNFFKNVGIGDETSAQLSEGLVQLAGDLASFKDLDPGDVLLKLRSGLAGESEPLHDLGVFLDDNTVKSKAMQLGLADAHGEISAGAKIVARYQIILEKTKDAQGDFARTSASLANQQRILAAEQENVSAKLGKAALPIVQQQTSVTNDLLDLVGTLSDASEKLGKISGGNEGLIGHVPGGDKITKFAETIHLIGKASDDSAPRAKNLTEALARYHDLVISGSKDETALARARDDVKRTADDERRAQELLTGAMGDGARATNEAAAAAKAAAAAEAELAKIQTSAAQASIDLPKLQRERAEALDDVAGAQQKLSAAQNLAPDPNDVAAAEDRVASAKLSVRDALADESDAQERLNDLRKTAIDLEAKQAAADRAEVNRKKAVVDEREAQEELDRVRRSGAGADYVEQAELKVQEAHANVEQATVDSKAAQKDLDDARRGSAARAREIERAEHDVERAAIGVRDARRNEKQAEDDLDKVRHPDKIRAVRDAQNELAAAIERAEAATSALAADQQKIATTAVGAGQALIQSEIASLATLLGLLPPGPARDSIQASIDQLKPLLGDTLISDRPYNGRFKASGGNVGSGPWIVGEDGPELLELGPNQSGRVFNSAETRRMLASGDAGGGVENNFYFDGAVFQVPDVTALRQQIEDLTSLSNLTFGSGR